MIPAAPVEGAPVASLVVSEAELAALLELARGGTPDERGLVGLVATGRVVDGAPAGLLADGLAALTAPVCELELQRGARRGRGGAGERFAALIVPAPEDGHRLIVAPTAFLPDVLSRLNDVSPRPRLASPAAVVLRYAPGELARILTARDAALAAQLAGDDRAAAAVGLVEGLREHWRVEARWLPAGGGGRSGRVVEVLDTDGGLWRVVADGTAVELRPSTPTQVFRELVRLLPGDAELAGAAEVR
jgi:hypothetical protein